LYKAAYHAFTKQKLLKCRSQGTIPDVFGRFSGNFGRKWSKTGQFRAILGKTE